MLQKSAVILAGGFSRRFGSDKGLVHLRNKPLVRHVIDNVSSAVDEILVVVSSEVQKKTFEPIVEHTAKLIIDSDKSQSPLIGTITGFEVANSEYSLLVPCDAPLISTKIVEFLFDVSPTRKAVIPRWTSGYVEPLQAVYHTQSALIAAKNAIKQQRLDMRSMINNLNNIRYVSTNVLKQLEPELLSFFNVNTPQDLQKAESVLK
ncbi:MAG: molybdenum cofactor guanylyltransferase [Candidatus Bathyarchaeota archaeon]|nr:molybdenum cofactor guanylyltransferase [Candidatus Bathyarchaeota archaeon]